MKRLFVLVGAAMMVMGCAVDSSDPVTQYPDREPTAEPPPKTTTFSGTVNERQEIPKDRIDPADLGPKPYDLGSWQVVPLPSK
jgi:hypothetical protein